MVLVLALSAVTTPGRRAAGMHISHTRSRQTGNSVATARSHNAPGIGLDRNIRAPLSVLAIARILTPVPTSTQDVLAITLIMIIIIIITCRCLEHLPGGSGGSFTSSALRRLIFWDSADSGSDMDAVRYELSKSCKKTKNIQIMQM